MTPAFTPLDGGCRCGQLRFRMAAEPIITHACHCRFCQQVSGAPFRVNAMIESRHLSILDGEPETYHGAQSQAVVQCPACHTPLWSYHPQLGEAVAFVGVGRLDEGQRLPPEAHYFTRSRHPWIVLPQGVIAFEELGDPGKPGARERIMAALAGGPGALQAFAGEVQTPA